MCGILGIVTTHGREPSVTDERARAMRDTFAHRGPDGEGLYRRENVLLAHRRLAVIDPSDAGHQPMLSEPDPATGLPRFAIVYNGELYNDADLRAQLAARGVRFRSTCDTETLLRAWATWGTETLARARGMFAFGVYDFALRTLTLARDPIGVKPLYYASVGSELVFASEPSAILAHPGFSAKPDWAMVSAYLSTSRTVLGDRTMFEGVRALRPGHVLKADLDARAVRAHIEAYWTGPTIDDTMDDESSAIRVREALECSAHAQLRSDVPICTLLSGGLDSSAIASIACARNPSLRSYAAGASEPDGFHTGPGDLAVARDVASRIGTDHAEAVLNAAGFRERWSRIVRATRVPMSTPNETAILAVAERLRADGCVVTLSGEGADELLGGYEGPMRNAFATASDLLACAGVEVIDRAGERELLGACWVSPELKPAVLEQETLHLAARDAFLFESYRAMMRESCAQLGGYDERTALAAHLGLHRRVNLPGLLQRLDTATMLASVEGRTPFADAGVAMVCESLPMRARFVQEAVSIGAPPDTLAPVRTKIALREAFRGCLPGVAVDRPKQSFPLPFTGWIAPAARALPESPFARSIFRRETLATVASQPERLWNLAWPMANLAMWGDELFS
ncbi:MAG: asparagine synthase (glutamine-hydrolyzing) [Planctomycetota bacterium]